MTAYTVRDLEAIADQLGTPFWLYDAAALQQRINNVLAVCRPADVQPRYAMKANSATRVLQVMRENGIWIDAVSGNECLRAMHAGYRAGANPPEIMLTADVFRDNALDVVREHQFMVNIGSQGMVRQLADAGYKGGIAVRLNPGFGHGHVNACDTGGPSSKHGIWWSHVAQTVTAAKQCGIKINVLHAHIGSGPQMEELVENLSRLVDEFAGVAGEFPDLEGISLGGGIPHNYRESQPEPDLTRLGEVFSYARKTLNSATGRNLRIEIEPGRYYAAPMGTLVGRVSDLKKTEPNEKGPGHEFIMVDTGFVDLVRPAMYGSFHRISIPAREGQPTEPFVVAGPLCESGDVFTRDADELLAPRPLPRPEPGDFICLHDGGAYGYSMASNYNSVGRVPQVWLDQDGSFTLLSRRETVDDVLKAEIEGGKPLPIRQ